MKKPKRVRCGAADIRHAAGRWGARARVGCGVAACGCGTWRSRLWRGATRVGYDAARIYMTLGCSTEVRHKLLCRGISVPQHDCKLMD